MIRRFSAAALAFAVAFTTLAYDANARRNNRDWELLGRQTVGFIADRT